MKKKGQFADFVKKLGLICPECHELDIGYYEYPNGTMLYCHNCNYEWTG